jgi:glycosyltransferase involved in cell wall biosynthesis
VFNEATTIERVVARVRDAEPNAQIVVVDDGSSDGTGEVLERIQQQHADSQGKLTVVRHEVNRGKGAALRTGFAHVTGDVVVIQDADMEYDPREFRLLMQPIVEGTADVVYGSRFAHGQQPNSPWWHRAANGLITRLSNVRTGLRFSDVETCYKVFRRELIDRLLGDLREDRFGIELEVTAKLARMKDVRFCERPISYAHRSYAEGKKIGWRDGISALRCILRY